MKSFEEQVYQCIKDRGGRDEQAARREARECATPAAQTLINYIRQWKFESRNVALARLIECDRWNGSTFVLERDFKGHAYPFQLPLAEALSRYRYGDQNKQFWPSYSFASGIKRLGQNSIPADWKKELQSMFFDMARLSLSSIKIISLGKAVKQLGVGNPHAYAQWDREVGEWKEAQAAVTAFCTGRKDFECCIPENFNKPEKRQEFSKILDDILANADAAKEPSYKAIKEQSRREHIGRDACGARNDIKGLKGFFQKYAEPIPNALTLLEGIVNDVQSKALTSGVEAV